MASGSASSSSSLRSLEMMGFFLFLLVLVNLSMAMAMAKAKAVPAMYVLGDSLVDVGNNNYIHPSVLKADFPHNGIDYPGGKPTGRFSNGKNAADALGMYPLLFFIHSLLRPFGFFYLSHCKNLYIFFYL